MTPPQALPRDTRPSRGEGQTGPIDRDRSRLQLLLDAIADVERCHFVPDHLKYPRAHMLVGCRRWVDVEIRKVVETVNNRTACGSGVRVRLLSLGDGIRTDLNGAVACPRPPLLFVLRLGVAAAANEREAHEKKADTAE